MLILSRSIDQRIFIDTPDGARLVIQVTAVRGNIVRLGVGCPPDYVILREELADRESPARESQR